MANWIHVLLVLLTLAIGTITDALPIGASCQTARGEPGRCIILTKCDELYSIVLRVRDQPNAIAERLYLQNSQCGRKDEDILICCPNRSERIFRSLPSSGECKMDVSNELRIAGGSDSHLGDSPWMVLLEYGSGKSRTCGGSLISHRYVLTASHCVVPYSKLHDFRVTGVRLGEFDLTADPDCEHLGNGAKLCAPKYVVIPVEKSHVHPSYSNTLPTPSNDIAILRLARRVEFSAHIRPLCLPLDESLRQRDLTGESFSIMGWGQGSDARIVDVKQMAEVTAVDQGSCRAYFNTLDDNQVCASGLRGMDTCQGDSGGPMVGYYIDKNDERYYYGAGVVSYGKQCGINGVPGVYTRVAPYIDWIVKIVKE